MGKLLQSVWGVRFGGEDWSVALAIATTLGVLTVGYYGWTSTQPASFSIALGLAGACLLVGVLLGFLFGIPRSLQSQEGETTRRQQQQNPLASATGAAAKNESPSMQYRANTNLEQISDWLTKILVGVGLTQLNNLPALFKSAGGFFGGPLGGGSSGSVFAVCVILYFTIVGFLAAYLWTRLFLGSELAKADLAAINQSVQEIKQAQEEQTQIDAKALSFVNQYLTNLDRSSINLEELKAAVQKASPPVKVQIFYQARESRKNSTRKPLMERTIPIFEALIASDPEKIFHKNYGQLGYALKDQREPNYAAAEKSFTSAIEIRGPARENGYEIYEFNRAICRIKQDMEFAKGQASSPERQELIRDDLKIAFELNADLSDSEVTEWQKLNS